MFSITVIIGKIKGKMAFFRYMKNEFSEQTFKTELSRRFNCTIDASAKIRIDRPEGLKIGSGVYIGSFTVIRVGGTSEASSMLEIGESTYIGELNNIRAGGGFIKIGKKCLISQQVSIIATNHGFARDVYIADQPWSTKKNVIIGDDVWIGCGVQIMPGVEIGSGAIVGAGSLVNKDIPPNAIVGGVPAEVLKFRE
jgi:acetyltransferase-like isoleucine patch superfamily enzyme